MANVQVQSAGAASKQDMLDILEDCETEAKEHGEVIASMILLAETPQLTRAIVLLKGAVAGDVWISFQVLSPSIRALRLVYCRGCFHF